MRISLEKNFLFVHVPKTGGISLRDAVEPYCLKTKKSPVMKVPTYLHIAPNWRWEHFRVHAPLVTAEKRLPAELYAGLTKFAVVRNPWARLVSFYHYEVQSGRKKFWIRHRFIKDFSSYLRWAAGSRSHRLFMFQMNMIENLKGEMGLDRVLRFENLADDFAALSRDLELGVELPHKNKSKHKDWREYYSDEDAAFVAERWKREIDELGYSFDGGG